MKISKTEKFMIKWRKGSWYSHIRSQTVWDAYWDWKGEHPQADMTVCAVAVEK